MKQRLETDQSVFKVYKGVKCFDFSKDKNIIVTGGMDRIVRLWNPYVPGLVYKSMYISQYVAGECFNTVC